MVVTPGEQRGRALGVQNQKSSVLRAEVWRAWPLKAQGEEGLTEERIKDGEGMMKNVTEARKQGF